VIRNYEGRIFEYPEQEMAEYSPRDAEGADEFLCS